MNIHSLKRLVQFVVFEKIIVYLLTKWEGRMGKYLARGHGVWTERHIFSHSARPNLVNRYFII